MLNPGDIVDNRFEVLALIGQGGLAEVFRVRHMELGSEYALKLLTWRREKLAERMVLEGRIQAQLKHPNIVSVVDLVRHEGQVGLLMEFINGDTLEGTILAGPTPVDTSLRLFSGVLAAVDAAHSAGVLHRDLKPANIMLARAGSTITPKVTDFGLAKVVMESASGMTKVGMTMGTPGYLAPEQLSDASTAGKQADVFALGIILYELLTGTRAFNVADGMVAVHATANEVPTPLHELRPDIPLNVCKVVQRAIDRDPSKRLQSCSEFANLLYSDHPSLLEQFSDGMQSRQVSLTLNGPSSSASGQGHTFNPAVTAIPPEETEPAKKRPAAVWLAAVIGGLALSVSAIAAIGYANWPPPAPAPGVPSAVVVPADVEPTPEPDAVADAEMPSATDAQEQQAPDPETPEPDVRVERPEPVPTAVPEPSTPEPTVQPPEADTEPGEPDTEAPEPDTEPAPVVTAVAVTAPVAVPAPDPVTAPTPDPVALLQLQGNWSGTAGRQRMTLDIDSTASGSVGGRMTLSLGPTVRTETVSGSLAPGGAISFTAGDFRFTGRATNSRLSGTYNSNGRGRTLDWSATR